MGLTYDARDCVADGFGDFVHVVFGGDQRGGE
jgi:hypothetical protein